MLKKYSHFSDLQATDKYKTNSTKARMYASLTGGARVRNFYFGEEGGSNFVGGGGWGGHIILE